MKRLIIIISFFVSVQILAQQIPQFTLWSQNTYLSNPALTGLSKTFQLKTGYRLQWAGFDGAPQTGYLTAHAPLSVNKIGYLTPYHGLGTKVERDVFGGYSNFLVKVSYGFHIPMGKKETLSFGTGVGMQQLGYDQINAVTIDPDLAVATNNQNFIFPRISFGAFYHREFMYAGLSLDHIARNKWKEIGLNSRYGLHASFTGGFKYTNDNDISFLPKFMLRLGPKAPPSADVQVWVDFQNKFALGMGYRNQDALSGMFRFKVKNNFCFAYSYDFILSSIRGGNFGSHELMLSITTARKKFSLKKNTPLFE